MRQSGKSKSGGLGDDITKGLLFPFKCPDSTGYAGKGLCFFKSAYRQRCRDERTHMSGVSLITARSGGGVRKRGGTQGRREDGREERRWMKQVWSNPGK